MELFCSELFGQLHNTVVSSERIRAITQGEQSMLDCIILCAILIIMFRVIEMERAVHSNSKLIYDHIELFIRAHGV